MPTAVISTIILNMSLRFLSIEPLIRQSMRRLNGVNISVTCANLKYFNMLILLLFYMAIIGGIVARKSMMKNPFRYDFEMSVNFLFFYEAMKKQKMISRHHKISMTQ